MELFQIDYLSTFFANIILQIINASLLTQFNVMHLHVPNLES